MAGEMPEESPDRGFPKLPVSPDTLLWGALFLSVMVVVLQTKRSRQLERELQAIRGNYSGVVSVLNSRKPCGCQDQQPQQQQPQEGVSQNGITGLYSTATPDSVPTPE